MPNRPTTDNEPPPNEAQTTLWVYSGVNPAGNPFIQLRLDNRVIAQLDPQQGVDHAMKVLEGVEASVTDAVIFKWATQRMNMTPEQIGVFLSDFRKFREQLTGTKAETLPIPTVQ